MKIDVSNNKYVTKIQGFKLIRGEKGNSMANKDGTPPNGNKNIQSILAYKCREKVFFFELCLMPHSLCCFYGIHSI